MRRASLACAAPLLLSLLAPAVSSAGSQLFKCVEGGHTVYQQQACPVSAQADAASSGAYVAQKFASEPVAKVVARVKPASPGASSAPATPR